MKGPAPPFTDSDDVGMPEMKVKRKCGRPRNPIPRHQRPSHIEAEQKRRVKIQEGLQALKAFLPKEYQTPGRESKADILNNSVRYMTDTHLTVQKQREELDHLRVQAAALNSAITGYQQNLPDEKLFEENPMSAEQRFDRLVSERTKENTPFSVFGYLMKPLHQFFEKMTDCTTLDAFHTSIRAWANDHLSRASLRPMITVRLQELSKEKSFMDIPEQTSAPDEVRQPCRTGRRAKISTPPATVVTPADICLPGSKRQAAIITRTNNKRNIHASKAPRPAASKRGRKNNARDTVESLSHLPLPSTSESISTLFVQDLDDAVQSERQAWSLSTSAAAIKTEELQPKQEFRSSCLANSLHVPTIPYHASCLEGTTNLSKVETPSWDSYHGSPARLLSKVQAESPLSSDSAISLSPPPSSSYESSLFSGDFLHESSLDQCYEVSPAAPSVCQAFLQGQSTSPPVLHRGGELEKLAESFDVTAFQSMVDKYQEPASAMDSDPSTLNMAFPSSDHMELLSDVDSPIFFGSNLSPSSVHTDSPCSMGTDSPTFITMVTSSSLTSPTCPTNTDPPSFMNLLPTSASHRDPPCNITVDTTPSFISMVSSSSGHTDPSPASTDAPSFISTVSSSSSSFDTSSLLLNTGPPTSAAVSRMDHSPAMPHEMFQQFLLQDPLQQDAMHYDGLQNDMLNFETLQFDSWQFDGMPMGEW